MKIEDWKPTKFDRVDQAFGAASTPIEELLPAFKDLPEEFQQQRGIWNRVLGQWFFKGINPELSAKTFVAKEGIDRAAALSHIAAVIGSFRPKHEHKMGGLAYLCSLWFEPITEFKPDGE